MPLARSEPPSCPALPFSTRATRRSVIALVVLGVTSAVTLTGCGGGTGDAAGPSASASPTPTAW